MREVIKSGHLKKKYEVTCHNCGCVFSFLYRDTYLSSYWVRYREVECPECGADVDTNILKDN